MKLGLWINIGVIITLLMTVLMAAVGVDTNRRLRGQIEFTLEERAAQLAAANDASRALTHIHDITEKYAISVLTTAEAPATAPETGTIETHIEILHQALADFKDHLAEFPGEDTGEDTGEEESGEEMEIALAMLGKSERFVDSVVRLMKTNDPGQMQKDWNAMQSLHIPLEHLLIRAAEIEVEELHEDKERASQLLRQAYIRFVLLLGSSVTLAIAFGFLTMGPVLSLVNRMSGAATKFVKTGKPISLPSSKIEELDRLYSTFSRMTSDLSGARERELEMHARQIEKISEANRAKSIFLTNMSHEIRTPMNAIIGFSQLLRYDSGLTQDQRDYIDAINHSGEHLLELISGVLEMSKIESGRVELDPLPFDPRYLTSELVAMFRGQATEKGIEIKVHVDEELPEQITADRNKLRQVLINLVGNAIKFTEQGWIDIRASGDRDAQGRLRLRFEVQDTGLGISRNDQKRIFNAFEQTREGALRDGSTGLGLAISSGYIEVMGGELKVESEVDRGSTFRFSIDTMTAPSETGSHHDVFPRNPPTRLAPEYRGTRALIVDDMPNNRKLLVDFMNRLGFETCEAADGREALRACKDFHPRIVLMDRHMPVMDGIEATRKIKAGPGGDEISIIGISASAFSEDVRKVTGAGCCAFLSKPVALQDLHDTIEKYTGITFDAPQPEGRRAATANRPRLDLAALHALPPGLTDRLRRLTINCDTGALVKLSVEIAEHDPAAAAAIRRLANDFRYDTLRAALNA